jgi:hypothetical protein
MHTPWRVGGCGGPAWPESAAAWGTKSSHLKLPAGYRRTLSTVPNFIGSTPTLPDSSFAEMWSFLGQDSSSAQVLEKVSLDGVASYIKKGKARKIVVMVRSRFALGSTIVHSKAS